MNSTSISLLYRLQQTDDSRNWNRLVELYAPLLRTWLRKYDVQSSDAEDLLQEVLIAVSKDLRSFDHNGRPGAFRSWLRTILVHRLRNFWRAQGRRPEVRADSDVDRRLDELEDPASAMSEVWNRQHDRHVVRQLLAIADATAVTKGKVASRFGRDRLEHLQHMTRHSNSWTGGFQSESWDRGV